jgi:hypothetical protein
MRRIIFSLLLLCSPNLFATEVEQPPEVVLLQLFEEQQVVEIKDLPDLVDKEVKITACVDDYIKRQSKTYAKIVKNNLYDLIHNFDRITSKIYGKKQEADEMSYEDKIGALAIVQCEAYYTIGVLK